MALKKGSGTIQLRDKKTGVIQTLTGNWTYNTDILEPVSGAKPTSTPTTTSGAFPQTQPKPTGSLIAPTPGQASPTQITDPSIYRLRPGESFAEYTERINKARGFTSEQTAGLPATSPGLETTPEAQEFIDKSRAEIEKEANKIAVPKTEFPERKTFKDFLTETETDFGKRPERPDLITTFEEQTATLGITDLQNEMLRVQNSIRALEDEVLSGRRKIKGEQVSSRVMQRQLVRLDQDTAEAFALLERERFDITQQLQTKQQTLNTVMNLTQRDYSNAVAEYNTKFSQAIQLYNVFSAEQDRRINNARADLSTITDIFQTAGKTWDDLSLEDQTHLRDLELQAGLPLGLTETALSVEPQDKILHIGSSTDEEGNTYFDIIRQRPDGSIYTQELFRRVTGKEGGGAFIFEGQAVAEPKPQHSPIPGQEVSPGGQWAYNSTTGDWEPTGRVNTLWDIANQVVATGGTHTDFVRKAREAGFEDADIEAWLDLETKLTKSSIGNLLEGDGEEKAGDFFTKIQLSKIADVAGITIEEARNLSLDEANRLLQEKATTQFLTDDQLKSIAESLVKQFGKDEAIKAIEAGTIPLEIGGTIKNIKLGTEQINKIKELIEQSTGEKKEGFFKKFFSGGFSVQNKETQ